MLHHRAGQRYHVPIRGLQRHSSRAVAITTRSHGLRLCSLRWESREKKTKASIKKRQSYQKEKPNKQWSKAPWSRQMTDRRGQMWQHRAKKTAPDRPGLAKINYLTLIEFPKKRAKKKNLWGGGFFNAMSTLISLQKIDGWKMIHFLLKWSLLRGHSLISLQSFVKHPNFCRIGFVHPWLWIFHNPSQWMHLKLEPPPPIRPHVFYKFT